MLSIDESLSRSEREAATTAAMDDRVPLVIGGGLPVDRMALPPASPTSSYAPMPFSAQRTTAICPPT